tara:strand:+ start:181 stop:468 length:288 start_codon:yes stop_codon:yes gene_type:complete
VIWAGGVFRVPWKSQRSSAALADEAERTDAEEEQEKEGNPAADEDEDEDEDKCAALLPLSSIWRRSDAYRCQSGRCCTRCSRVTSKRFPRRHMRD